MKKILIVILLCMLLIVTVLPVSANINIHSISEPLSLGNILYVGGGGPGNYSTIQEAIDDSVDRDTVFVFDDSSPYIESILVDKSIDLLGENKETTIIEGTDTEVIINVKNDDVTISGFTIQNNLYDGILINRAEEAPWKEEIFNVNVFNNNIKNVSRGIFGITLLNGKIYGNNIQDSSTGIKLGFSSNINVSNNYISDCDYRGIEVHSIRTGHNILFRILKLNRPPAENNTIYRNTVEHNRWGINIGSACSKTMVIENNIINNFQSGVDIQTSSNIEIKRNNFIKTENYLGYNHAEFTAVKRYNQYFTNSWDENYWNEPLDKPVAINGIFYFILSIPIGLRTILELDIYEHNLVAYDRNPAQEPYEIEM